MKAIGYIESLPVSDERSLFEFEAAKPAPGPHDLLVQVRAISVNPVDTKVRMRRQGSKEAPVILGWDVAGVVEAVGKDVTLFKAGDEVYYAGDITRPGGNAEYNLVDERIAALKPKSLDFAAAAALPLTAITAWEALFDRLKIKIGKQATDDAILIIGAAGGVGSIAVQLARRLTGLTVIGSASRPETAEWAKKLGAHHVIDHGRKLSEELKRIGIPQVRYIFSVTQTDRHWDEIVASLAPQGEICLIDDPKGGIDVMKIKGKAGALHIEMMFARSMHQTPDMIQQHKLLSEVAGLVDEGLVKTTLGQNLGRISAANLRKAHAALESGATIGKVVLEGF
jgi:zinc-binding alcohol dehydrogenase family protein